MGVAWFIGALDALCDEDIHTLNPSPPHDDDRQVAAKKKSNDEIRIGPITRARAKLLEQQVNSLLVENAIYFNESFILPKSLYLCVIRYMGEGGVARGSEELQQEEHDVMINHGCAREEREAGALQERQSLKTVFRPDYPAC